MKNGYLSLWLLLALAFAFFFVLSCFDLPEILGHEFKSTGMADVLCEPIELVADTDTGSLSDDSIGNVAGKMSLFPVETDTAKQTFLFIGDSMLDGLSPRLAAYANASGHKQYSVIWYSSTSQIWAESGKLSEYIEKVKPTFVFICLGSNELIVKNIKEKRREYVEKIVGEIGDIPFLWIGPPNWKEDTGINDLIRESVPEGSYFRSAGMTFRRKKDGAHPTAESAAMWLDSIIRWMPMHSNHPLVFARPEKPYGRPDRIFTHTPQER